MARNKSNKSNRRIKVNNKPKKMVKVIMQPQKKIIKQKRRNKVKVSNFGNIIRTAGRLAGSYLGNPILGSQVGAGISRIFGQGDYVIKENSLTQGGAPSFAALNSGLRIHHREFVGDVLSSRAFNNTTYQITPTNSLLFPWLSNLAYNFEEFRFKGLVFYFNTTSGSAVSSTNNALGVVGMTTVYDPTDPDLTSKREAEDYAGCVSGVPASSILHPVECKLKSNVLDRLYVQTAALTNPEDLKFYSHGKLNLFTQGMQADDVNIGEFWVSYDIEFYNPKIQPLGTINQLFGRWYAPSGTLITTGIFGAPATPVKSGNLKFIAGANTITLPQSTSTGYYWINMWHATPASSWEATISNFAGNASLVNAFKGLTSNREMAPETLNNLPLALWRNQGFLIRKNDTASLGITFTTTGVMPSTAEIDLFITKLPPSLVADNVNFLSKPPLKKELSVIYEEDKEYDVIPPLRRSDINIQEDFLNFLNQNDINNLIKDKVKLYLENGGVSPNDDIESL